MRPVYAAAFAVIAVPFLMGASECDGPKSIPAKNEQADKAKAAANSIVFAENAEIENIKWRLQLTSQPGLQGFIILLNSAGQPILYEAVVGKVTSGSKRLTPTYEWKHRDCGQYGCDKEVPAPSDEGTYGSSAEYVFYKNQAGQYRQWNGMYLYSDKPFRLNVEPLAVAIASEGKR